jgi:flagellar biosynthesis protein
MATSDTPEFDRNKIAVALTYERNASDLPRVSAKGKGLVADAIIELAKKHNIEVRKDTDLAVLLSKLEIDMPIPLEAYAAVAEILAYVYKANDKAKNKT